MHRRLIAQTLGLQSPAGGLGTEFTTVDFSLFKNFRVPSFAGHPVPAQGRFGKTGLLQTVAIGVVGICGRYFSGTSSWLHPLAAAAPS